MPKLIDKYDTLWLRIGARLVDAAILMPLILGPFFIITSCGSISFSTLMTLRVLYIIIGTAYNVGLTARCGQTLGKMATGVKILRVDGGAISYVEAFWRYAPWLALGTVWVVAESIRFADMDKIDFMVMRKSRSWVSWLSNVWTIALIISVLANEKRRAVHDFIAGTEVVRLEIADKRRTVVTVLVACGALGVVLYSFALGHRVTGRFREKVQRGVSQ